ELVHQAAPRPKAVSSIRPAFFGQSGHRALEGMAMQIDRGWQQYTDIHAGRGVVSHQIAYDAIADGNFYMILPSGIRQGGFGPQFHIWPRFGCYSVGSLSQNGQSPTDNLIN
ncbi:MAG: hypothetical protein EBR92_06960, partial [Alphaproteobacteria bacterium]|nr:hypothetical protein [Alphaproteobacteria bacterium]